MLKTVSSITNAIGALNYKGTWNASTNSPALASGVGTKGDYYVVSVAGSTALDGISNWGVGDWAAYNGAAWQRVEGGADLNGVNLSVSGTSTLSNLTASTALALNASKEIVSVTNTGTGNNVLATSPTLVGDVTLSTGNVVVGTSGKGITTGSAIPLGLGVNGNTTQVIVNTSGDLLVGTGFSVVQDINSQLRGRIIGTGPSYGFFEYFYGAFRSGYLIWDSTSLSLVNLSDYRIKENVVDLTSALDRLQQLKPRKFNFISDPSKTVDGFVAHELGEVIPQAVFGEKDAVDESGNPVYQAIDQSKIIPLLVASIQELKAEFDAYKASHP
jgi:hypothetical protein